MRNVKCKKNLCLLIAVTMLFSLILSSCGSSGASVDDVVRRTAITLSLYVISESATPEAIADVEKELNRITEGKLTTRIKLFALPQAEYIAAINKCFEKYDEEQLRLAEEASIQASLDKASKEKAKADKAAGITQEPTKKPTDPPQTTELYTEKIVYEELKDNQLDIFLITSSDMFETLARESRLASMNEELTTKAKVLYEYIHPSIMQAGQFNGNTYAIPTNRIIGETTYMAINKRLLEEYNAYAENHNSRIEEGLEEGDTLAVVDVTKIKDFDSLTDYLLYVKSNHPDVALVEGPISPDRSYEQLFPEYPRFVLAANAGKSAVYTPSSMPVPTEPRTNPPETDEDGNIIETETEEVTIPKETVKPQPIPAVVNNTPDRVNVVDRLKAATMSANSKMNQLFRDEGLFVNGSVSEGTERSVFLRTGTLEDYYGWIQSDEYEYEYITFVAPQATRDELQSAMFAISASTTNVMRAMEVVTLLSTNKTFKNTFQYGVQGVHYIYNDHGRIERLNNDYIMNTNYTGNTFISDLMEGENPDKWSIAMEHNLQVVNSVFLNFYLDRSKFDEGVISTLNTLSEKYYNELLTGQFSFPESSIAISEEEVLDVSTLATYSERLDAYIQYVMTPDFEANGLTEFLTLVKEQTVTEE